MKLLPPPHRITYAYSNFRTQAAGNNHVLDFSLESLVAAAMAAAKEWLPFADLPGVGVV